MGCLCRTDEHETDCGYGISKTGAAGWFNCGRENCNWCPRPSEKGHPRIPTEADLAAQAELMESEPDPDPVVNPFSVAMQAAILQAQQQLMSQGVQPTAAIVHPNVAAQITDELTKAYIQQLDAQIISISGLNDLLTSDGAGEE